MKNEMVYISHMRDAGRDVVDYCSIPQEEFFRDNKTQDAVIRKLEIMGEAAAQVPPALRDRYPGIPWRQIISMRNKLIHDYHGIDLQTVWLTATIRVPVLVEQLEEILKAEE